jgi:hypothetical protein
VLGQFANDSENLTGPILEGNLEADVYNFFPGSSREFVGLCLP